MGGAHSRRKGAQGERDIALAMRTVFPGAKRGIGQARSAGEVADVEGTPYWVECKRGKKCNVRAAYAQAMAATDGRPVVVVVRDDGGEPMVYMSLEDWLDTAGGEDNGPE